MIIVRVRIIICTCIYIRIIMYCSYHWPLAWLLFKSDGFDACVAGDSRPVWWGIWMLPSFVTYAHSTAFKQLTYVRVWPWSTCLFVMHGVRRGCVHVCMCVIVCVHAYDSCVCPVQAPWVSSSRLQGPCLKMMCDSTATRSSRAWVTSMDGTTYTGTSSVSRDGN